MDVWGGSVDMSDKMMNLRFDKIPSHLQNVIKVVKARTNAPVEIILPTLLGVMSLACQDLIDVQVSDDITYPTSLFMLILAGSGSKKTTVHNLLMKPVYDIEKTLYEEFKSDSEQYETDMEMWNVEKKTMARLYTQACLKQSDECEVLKSKLIKLHDNKPKHPDLCRFTINDLTSEALRKELSDGYPSLVIMSDEAGGLFDGSLFRKTPWINTLWSGQKVRISRASKEAKVIQDARLGMTLMLQPSIFDEFLYSNGKKLRASGFLARCLLVDLDEVEHLHNVDNDGDESEALDDFYSSVEFYLTETLRRRKEHRERIHVTLSQSAKEQWMQYCDKINTFMKVGHELHAYSDYMARMMEHVSRVAAVMQVFISKKSTKITGETFESALYIFEWHLNHFIEKVKHTSSQSDHETLEQWLNEHVISNRSFIFRRNKIIKFGPLKTRVLSRLVPALEKLQRDKKVELYHEDGVNLVRFIGAEISPMQLCDALGDSILLSDKYVLEKMPTNK